MSEHLVAADGRPATREHRALAFRVAPTAALDGV